MVKLYYKFNLMDQYSQDYKKAEALNQELVESLKERAELISKG